jgi:hypothetical protein
MKGRIRQTERWEVDRCSSVLSKMEPLVEPALVVDFQGEVYVRNALMDGARRYYIDICGGWKRSVDML